jgi:hypothetical protein
MEVHSPNPDGDAEIPKGKFTAMRTSEGTKAKPKVTDDYEYDDSEDDDFFRAVHCVSVAGQRCIP